MALPGVNIELENGALGGVAAGNDGVAGLLITGVTVAGDNKVTENVPYQITSLDEAIALGIDEGGTNDFAHRQIALFYTMAGEGSTLWIMLVNEGNLMGNFLLESKGYATKLLDAAGGSVKILAVSAKYDQDDNDASVALSTEVNSALNNGQLLADKYAAKFMPFRLVVDGFGLNDLDDLSDLKTNTQNRCAVMLGNSNGSKNSDVGLVLGDLASLPVQRKISRVRNGSLPITKAYLPNGAALSSHLNDLDGIHDKGYVTFRTFVGKSGYFFSSDPTATSDADDYSSIARGRVIDKAIRLAYSVYLEEIDDEITLNDDGTIDVAEAKDLQGRVEAAINTAMVANGEASAVEAYIDVSQNVLSTDKIKVQLRVLPVGYKSFIEVSLGFASSVNN